MTPGGLGAAQPQAELQRAEGEPCVQGWGKLPCANLDSLELGLWWGPQA